LEEVRRVFSGLPVYVGVEDGYVYVKRTAPMDQRQFRRYLETCRRLGFRFDRRGEVGQAAGGAEDSLGLRRHGGPADRLITYWVSCVAYTAARHASTPGALYDLRSACSGLRRVDLGTDQRRDNTKTGEAKARHRRGVHHSTNLNPQSAPRRMALFPAFFLVFAFARRRRMVPRFHLTPCEMNVKRGFKPTAEPTKNRRKT